MKTSLRDHLIEILPEKYHKNIPRGFEVVGDIAIIEVPDNLVKFEREIGESILKVNSHIKVVLKKSGIHKGEFRTQKLDYLFGEKRKETLYIENGVRIKLNVETVYFSSKLSTEREILSSKVKENSKVLVMFSGCGPYTFNILKKQPNLKRVDSIEINPEGHKYALENLELNKNLLKKSKRFKNKVEKLKNNKEKINEKEIISQINKETVRFFNEDVRKVLQNELLEEKYDEIFMPLPKDAELFLDCAFKASRPGTIVHMYDFVHESEFPSKSETSIKSVAEKLGRDVRILETRKVGQYSPRKYRVCCDFEVLG